VLIYVFSARYVLFEILFLALMYFVCDKCNLADNVICSKRPKGGCKPPVNIAGLHEYLHVETLHELSLPSHFGISRQCILIYGAIERPIR
jgi:hypothetical protein